jgi:hypothetical protein
MQTHTMDARATDPIIDRFREHRSCNTRDLSAALDGQDVIVRVVSLHDGDTLTAVFEALGGFYKIHVRLDGIDAPEMNATSPANRKVAVLARDRMLALIVGENNPAGLAAARRASLEVEEEDKHVCINPIDALLDADVYVARIHCGRCEKYGRLLGKVSSAFSDALSPSFGDVLVNERLALEYRGGKKMTEAEQMRMLCRDETTGELVDNNINNTKNAPRARSGFLSGWMFRGR